MNNKVCASIITYNIDEKIIEVVNSIINQVDNIVIVDNGSNSITLDILNELSKKEKVELILNNENIGIAKALNKGIKFAKEIRAEWILTLDHDSVCEKNMISDMFKAIEGYNSKDLISILTPKIFEMNKKDFISKKYNERSSCMEVNDCIQSGSLFNMDTFDEIGLFNEELFIYHVDFDFCQRVLKSGRKIMQCNNTVLYHEEGYKIPKNILGKKVYYNNYSSQAIYYITRNTVYMGKTYSVFYIKRILKDFIHIMLFDKNRKERMFYWIRGLKDGISNKYGKLN